MRRAFARAVALAAALATGIGLPALARAEPIKTTFVHLAMDNPAVLYEPVKPGAKAQIAVLVTHGGDYLTFPACTELSQRGYRVLCADPSGAELDRTLAETKLGVDYLRALPGVRKVVLLGHSGGATIVTAYQSIAENGVKICQDPRKIHKCPNSLAGLTPADGVLMPDANMGNALVALFSVDPAVVNDDTGMALDPDLDMFDPRNGFKPGGTAYSPEFTKTFFQAEAARYNRIVDYALHREKLIATGNGLYEDDEPFTIAGASSGIPNNKLYSQDTRLLSHSRQPWPLIHKDGSVTTEVIRTVRLPSRMGSQTRKFRGGALRTTVREFLSSQAIRVSKDFHYDESAVSGVDWTSSYADPPGNVESIGVPLLAMGMTGHWESLAAEEIYDHARSKDKSIAFVEGAEHMYGTCKECETTPGQFGDTTKTLFDYVDKWLGKKGRFLD